MCRSEQEPKGDEAACVAGRAGESRCVYEKCIMANRFMDDGKSWSNAPLRRPRALCAHAWNTEHAGTAFPDGGDSEHQEAGGLLPLCFFEPFQPLPLRLYPNAGACQRSERLQSNVQSVFQRIQIVLGEVIRIYTATIAGSVEILS